MKTVYGFRTGNSTAIGLTEKGKKALENADGYETFEKQLPDHERYADE